MKLTDKQKRDAFQTGVAPKGVKFMVLVHNTDGRMCAFARGSKLAEVREYADRLWATHGDGGCCYPGEERGFTDVVLTDDKPIVESKILYNPQEGL